MEYMRTKELGSQILTFSSFIDILTIFNYSICIDKYKSGFSKLKINFISIKNCKFRLKIDVILKENCKELQ